MVSGVMTKVKSNPINVNHRAKSLQQVAIPRTFFDPSNEYDRAVYDVFRRSGKWVKHFHVEEPFSDVTSTIENKLIDYFMSQTSDMSNEIAAKNEIVLKPFNRHMSIKDFFLQIRQTQ